MLNVAQRDRLITITKDIINIESERPNNNEKKVADFIYSFLKVKGFSPEKQMVDSITYNIICKINGNTGKKTIMFNGHMDVVPAGNRMLWNHDPYDCIEIDGRLYGRGTCDMKGGIACMLFMAELVSNGELKLEHNLLLTFTIDEESTNTGIKEFIKKDITADYCIIGEPTNLEIAIGHRGVMTMTHEVFGENAHIAQSDDCVNAIEHTIELIKELEKLNNTLKTKKLPLLGSPQLKVTTIIGGTKANINPNYCKIETDRRMVLGENKETHLTEIKEIKERLTQRLDKFQMKSSEISSIPTGYINEDSEPVQSLSLAYRLQTGENPVIKAFEASCEQAYIQDGNGIQCVIFGPGNLKQAHTINEYIEIKQMCEYVEIMGCLLSANR